MRPKAEAVNLSVTFAALAMPHAQTANNKSDKRKSLVIMFIVKGLSYITAKLVVIYDTNKQKAHYFNFMRFFID